MSVAFYVESQFSVGIFLLFLASNDFHLDISFCEFSMNRPLLDHLEEGGDGLRPYCNLLPGGKFGFFFQQMQNLYFYMLILSNNNSIDDQKVSRKWDKTLSSFQLNFSYFTNIG